MPDDSTTFRTVSETVIKRVSELLQTACQPCLAGDYAAALGFLEQAVALINEEDALDGDAVQLWRGFARHLVYSWMLVSRWELLVRLLRLFPWDTPTMSLLLHAMHFLPEVDRGALAQWHRRWGERFSPSESAPESMPHPDPERRLRIGYLSPDFRAHCVATFLEEVLKAHDRTVVEVFGYGNIPPEQCDAVTERMASSFDAYRDIWAMDNEAAVGQIRGDDIDILVDLAGHTHNHRLEVMAQRPAPIQVTYLGYPNTTGLSQCDYRITDGQVEPTDSESLYTENRYTLDTCFACFTPPLGVSEVSDPPVIQGGSISFGSFVGSAKHNPALLACWARILKETPNSRLLLRFQDADQGVVQQQCRQTFAHLGVDPARIHFDGVRSYAEHLASYGQVDIALDSFPWSSHTSLCEALYMGVPVISLRGNSFVSRMGHSVLYHVGLEGFSADSETAYVEKAVSLARQPETLVRLRRNLRTLLVNSVVCDAKRQARALEEAYRVMWRKVCH